MTRTIDFFKENNCGTGLVADLTQEQIAEELFRRFQINRFPGRYSRQEIANREWVTQYPEHENFTYEHNSWGFRDHNMVPEFDTAFVGCSVTYGVGVPREFRFSDILARELNLHSYNFGIRGIGHEAITDVFALMVKNLKFKRAVVMYPSLHRKTMPIKFRANGQSKPTLEYLQILPHLNPVRTDEQYEELNHIRDTLYSLPDSWFVDQFRSHVHLVKLMADLAGIKVVFSSWSIDTRICLELIAKNHKDMLVTAPSIYTGSDNQARDQKHPGYEQNQYMAKQIRVLL